MSAYDYDFYKNSEVKQEIINELAEEIFKDNVDVDEVFKVKKCSNKFCWKNFIRIFEAASYENKLKGIPIAFGFLQDENWPVFPYAVNFLVQFEDGVIEPYIEKYLEQAQKEDDEMWIDGITFLKRQRKTGRIETWFGQRL